MFAIGGIQWTPDDKNPGCTKSSGLKVTGKEKQCNMYSNTSGKSVRPVKS